MSTARDELCKPCFEPVLFEPDELTFYFVKDRASRDSLLETEGIFYLKDLAGPLRIDPGRVIRRVRQIKRKRQRVYQTMGIAKIWGHWIVRMKVFADHVRVGKFASLSKVEPHWDGNQLLAQDGIFPLTDVCRLLPFAVRQLRYHAIHQANAKETMGVWKDQALNTFVVDMPVFREWVKQIWLEQEPADGDQASETAGDA